MMRSALAALLVMAIGYGVTMSRNTSAQVCDMHGRQLSFVSVPPEYAPLPQVTEVVAESAIPQDYTASPSDWPAPQVQQTTVCENGVCTVVLSGEVVSDYQPTLASPRAVTDSENGTCCQVAMQPQVATSRVYTVRSSAPTQVRFAPVRRSVGFFRTQKPVRTFFRRAFCGR